MKIRYLILIAALTLLAGVASAGLKQPAPVTVDLTNMIASGDQVTARIAPDDVSFIGCGIRVTDDGVNPLFVFGFCQAGDSEENTIVCFTQNPNLLNAMATGRVAMTSSMLRLTDACLSLISRIMLTEY